MAVGDEYECRIPRAIPAGSAGRFDEPIDLLRRQVLSSSPFAIREAPRWGDFPVFEGWLCLSNRRIRRRSRA
jgi:hypothetical protein